MTFKKHVQMALFTENKRTGYTCSCCGQFVKLYSRHFNSGMAIALLTLYKHRDKGFVHLEDLMAANGFKRCGDASYLRHYMLIEPYVAKRNDGSNRNGHYRITGLGIMFAENKIKVQERFLTFNNKCEGFEGKEISIIEALGEKYNYQEMFNQ